MSLLSLPERAFAAADRDRPIAGGVLAWLLDEGSRLVGSAALLGGLCRRLVEEGLPLYRVATAMRTLHPDVAAIGLIWRVGDEQASETPRLHGILESTEYLESPVRRIHEGATEIRRRLEGPDAVADFPVLVELREEGVTDYLALPLTFSSGRLNMISFTTTLAGGFNDREIADLKTVVPIFALALEAREIRRVTRALLHTYLGREAGARVLNGTIRRGQGETIAAALWFCDLRGFTAAADSLSRADTIALLNDYFEYVAAPVHARGGEVMKFIGDGMLAMFPIADDLDRDRACHDALAAAETVLDGLPAFNASRLVEGKLPIEIGLALHMGSVSYGNIGAPGRLDFTVIGPAVNMVSRLEGLCTTLGRSLVASSRFASPCGSRLVSLGRYTLKGIEEPQEVFGLPDE